MSAWALEPLPPGVSAQGRRRQLGGDSTHMPSTWGTAVCKGGGVSGTCPRSHLWAEGAGQLGSDAHERGTTPVARESLPAKEGCAPISQVRKLRPQEDTGPP